VSRALSAAMLAAIQQKVIYPAIFFKGEFVSDTLYLWSGLGNVTWDGQVWVGLGNLMSFGEVKETSNTEATTFTLSVTGESSANVSRALQSCRRNKPGYLYLALLDAAGAIIADPYQLRAGRFSHSQVNDDGKTAIITVVYEDELNDLRRARAMRYTSESQALLYPNDKGFDNVAQLQDANIMWAGG
jgi:hypothetical protein